MVTFFDPQNIVQMVGLQSADVGGIGTPALFGDNQLEVGVIVGAA